MFQFLKRLWNWLTHWFPKPEPPPVPPPSNIDWESHFFALLKEVEKGKRWEALQPFLIERQVDLHGLAEWMQKFGERLQQQETIDPQLLANIQRLGAVAHSEVGIAAQTLMVMLPKSTPDVVIKNDARSETVEQQSVTLEEEPVEETQTAETGSSTEESHVERSPEVQVLLEEGDRKCNEGDYCGAYETFDAAVKIAPKDPKAWFLRGRSLGLLERYEEALASFNESLKIQPCAYRAWFLRGGV